MISDCGLAAWHVLVIVPFTMWFVEASESYAMLGALLDDGLSYDATTNRGLTNHLPMALAAKAGLGAPPEELTRFAARYVDRLVAIDETSYELTRATWARAIGEPYAYADLVNFFNGEVQELGVDAMVRAYLENLVEGVSGAAFHGVIRLAYALDVASPSRVSTAMAYFAANATTLAPLGGEINSSDSPEELLRQLATSGEWSSMPSMKLITEEMQWVAARPTFTHVASSLAVDDETPRRLAEIALKVYATTDDFTALHGVTGLEALARLRRFVDDVERFDRFSFQAFAAAYLALGAPPIWSSLQLSEFASTTVLDVATVTRRAALSDDEHVAKLVFTAQRLHAGTDEPLYFAIAERKVGSEPSRDETVN
jgi:hypothetical protein